MKAEGHLHREEEICVNITAFGDDDVHVRAIAELVWVCVPLSRVWLWTEIWRTRRHACCP